MITKEQLALIMPHASNLNVVKYHAHLVNAMEEYQINTPLRIAAFLAQLAHESGSLRYVRELASGEAYEGRKDLGNNKPGYGIKYKGRGLIQITGFFNYKKLTEAFGVSFVDNPEMLEEPKWATLSAAWFWGTHNLNMMADKQMFKSITRIINGGLNGYADRLEHYERAIKVLTNN